MKKTISKIITVILIVTLSIGASLPTQAAAFKYGTISDEYTYKVDGQLRAQANYKLVKVKGKSTAAKRINRKINNIKKTFLKEWREMKQAAETEFREEAGFYSLDYTMKVVKNDKKAFSVLLKYYSYTQGSHGYAAPIGCTFNKKTGKIMTLAAYAGKDSNMKNKIIKSFKKWNKKNGYAAYDDAQEYITKKKLKDFNYYAKGNYVYVCFSPYEIAPYAVGSIKLKIRI